MQISNFWWIFKRIESEVCVTWNDYAKICSLKCKRRSTISSMSTTQTALENSKNNSTICMYTILGQGSVIDWNLPVEDFSIFALKLGHRT